MAKKPQFKIDRTGPWKKTRELLITGPALITRAADRAVRQEAELLRKEIVKGLNSQAPGGNRFKPLSKTTLAVRRSQGFRGRKALIRSGALRRSISAVHTRQGSFVGVLRSARSADGKRLTDIAQVQEFGSRPIVIRVSDKMRKAIMAKLREGGLRVRGAAQQGPGKLSTGLLIVQIPARPFLRPVFEKFAQGADKRMEKRMAGLLSGAFGRV